MMFYVHENTVMDSLLIISLQYPIIKVEIYAPVI